MEGDEYFSGFLHGHRLSMVFSQMLCDATTEITGAEFTSCDRVPSPDLLSQWVILTFPGGTNIDHSISPPMADSLHMTFNTPTSLSRTIANSSLTLNTTTATCWEGSPLLRLGVFHSLRWPLLQRIRGSFIGKTFFWRTDQISVFPGACPKFNLSFFCFLQSREIQNP